MITLLGNCQIERLQFVMGLNGFTDYRYFANTERLDDRFSLERILDAVAVSDAVVAQPILEADNPLSAERLLAINRNIVFAPYIFVDGYFCLSSADGAGTRVYGGKYVTPDLRDPARGLGHVVEAFKWGRIDFANQARFDASLMELRRREQLFCQVSVSSFIEERFRDTPMFVTHNHPSANLFDDYVRQIHHTLGLRYRPLSGLQAAELIEYVFAQAPCVFSPYDARALGVRFGHDPQWFNHGFPLLRKLSETPGDSL